MIKLNNGDPKNFSSEEEFFAYFKQIKKDQNINVLYEPIFYSKYLFIYLNEKNLMDSTYLNKIKENFGTYYIGENNVKALFDGEIIVNFIYEREKLYGYSKEDIEDFFLSIISASISLSAKASSYERYNLLAESLGKRFGTIDNLEINPIPKKIKEIRLNYYNFEQIAENLDLLKDLSKDKTILQIIENLKLQLK